MTKLLRAASLALLACLGCGATNPTGGPHYYGGWGSYFVPIVPTDPISKDEATKRPRYCEAVFDGQGRIVRFTKYSNGRVESETRYSYRPDRSFEEQVCTAGRLVVTVYDKDGTEKSSTTPTDAATRKRRCPIGWFLLPSANDVTDPPSSGH